MAKKQKLPPSEEAKLLKKFEKKLKLEAIMKSILIGFVCGFALCIPISIISFIASFNTIWISLGVLVAATAGFAVLAYMKYYKTSLKKTASRVDGVGLEERMITMLEFADRDDAIVARQRADAREALTKVEPKHVKIPFPKTAVIAVAVAAAIAVVMIVTSTVHAVRAEEEAAAAKVETPAEETEEDKIIREMIEELRKEINDSKVKLSLKNILHGMVDDLEESIRPTDSTEIKIAKISVTAQKIHKLIQDELSRYILSDQLKKHETTKDMGKAIEAADMTAIKESTEALYGLIEPSIESGSFDTLIQTAGDLVQSLLDAGYDVDEDLQKSVIAAGYPLVVKKQAEAKQIARTANANNAKAADTVPDNDALAEALEKLAQDLMDALPQPDDPGYDKDMAKDKVDQAIQDAVESITGAVQDQVDKEQTDEELQDTIKDSLEQLGFGSSDPDDKDKDPDEEDKKDEESDEGPAHPNEDGEIVYDSVIDGKTPYMDVYDEFYQQVLDRLTSGDLTEEERIIIENYFNILN